MSEGLGRDETQVYSSQFGSYDHPQQPFGALDSVATAPRLHKDVQHNAILIDSTPEITLDTLDWNKPLVEVPLISGPRPTPPQATGKMCTELFTPGPYRLVGDLDAALSQDQVNARWLSLNTSTAR